MVEVKLNCGERLVAMQLLPKEGSFATLRLLRELTGKLGLSADEVKEFEVEETGEGRIKWGKKGMEDKPIEFKEKEIDKIVTNFIWPSKQMSEKDVNKRIKELFYNSSYLNLIGVCENEY